MSQDEDTLTAFVSLRPVVTTRRWALRALAGPIAGALFDTSKDLVFGRGASANVRCVDPSVSRAHAVVRARGERLFIEDLGSRNGTLVGGRLIDRVTELHEGDRVELGALGMRVVREDDCEIQESKRLYEAATCDAVTGVFNRSHFDMRLACALDQARNEKKPAALLMVDVDYFKAVNDRFGHLTGDAVLRCVGSEITSVVRPQDTVARWGGEEFAVLLPRTSPLEAALVADRVCCRVARLDLSDLGMDHGITVSIGVSTEPEAGSWLPSELLAAADAAVYRAKAEGRNRVHVYCEETALEAELLRGLDGLHTPERVTAVTADFRRPLQNAFDEPTLLSAACNAKRRRAT